MISNAAVHHHRDDSESNYALDLDGSNDYIQLNGGTISTAWTVEVWYRKSSDQSTQVFIGNSNSTNSSGTWALKMEQYNNTNNVGITKFGSADYRFNSASTTAGKWNHVVWTYESNVVTCYINGVSAGTLNITAPILYWNVISQSRSIEALAGKIDEVRIWNDKRTASEIADNMFLELSGNETGLVAYYKMSNGSGTTVDDDSSNSNNGTMTNMAEEDWVTSYAPIGKLNDSYKTNIKSIWKATGTSSSIESDGLSMSVSSELAEQNFVIYGNNGSSSTTTNDIPAGITKRSARVFQFDLTGSVSANIKIDIGDVSGFSGTPGATSNYKLLYRPIGCTGSCDYSILATAASVSSTDIFEFTNISVQDGYYAIGSADSNL